MIYLTFHQNIFYIYVTRNPALTLREFVYSVCVGLQFSDKKNNEINYPEQNRKLMHFDPLVCILYNISLCCPQATCPSWSVCM